MLDDQNRQVRVLCFDIPNEVHQLEHFLRIQTRSGLVQHQNLGVGHQRAGNLNTALNAVGQIGRTGVGILVKLQQLQAVHGLLLDLFFMLPVTGQQKHGFDQAALAVVVQRHLNVVQNAQTGEQTGVLEGTGDTQTGHFDLALLGDVHTIEHNGTGIELINLGNQVENRRLTGTVGADDGGDRTGFDLKIEIPDCGNTAEVFA